MGYAEAEAGSVQHRKCFVEEELELVKTSESVVHREGALLSKLRGEDFIHKKGKDSECAASSHQKAENLRNAEASCSTWG